uniref:Stanniocalcin n=1 Tax=Gasterosteus aculeatus aculeatus TaxID=481459 RepID=A0AAQ4RSJ0_GASAC
SMPAHVSALLFLLVLRQQVLTLDLRDAHEKQGSQVKKRLSAQSAAEIQSCLVSSGDVGCGTFQCFNNNSCEIQGLHHICLTLLHNAGCYDSQGKSFVKEALRCMALGLRQRFSCVSRRCSAVKEMVFSLQRECYSKHQLCLARVKVKERVLGFLRPHVELMNFLLRCGDSVGSWVGQRLRAQCEHHWGALCSSFGSTCSHSQADTLQDNTTAAAPPPPPVGSWHGTNQAHLRQPTEVSEPEPREALSRNDNQSEKTNATSV